MTETAEKPPVTLAYLEAACQIYAASRADLAAAVDQLEADIAIAKRKHGAAIVAALAQHNTLRDALTEAVTAAPAAIFVRPRTYQFHGIKVGRQKGPGGLQFEFEDARTVELIRKHFAAQQDVLISVRSWPNKSACAELPAKDLARIGGKVVEAGDAIVVRAINTDLDKLIQALSGDSGLTEQSGEPA